MNAFDYIKQSIYFLKQNFATLAAIQVPFLLAVNALALWVDQNDNVTMQSVALVSLLSLLVMPIYWGATIFFMQSILDGTPLSPSQALAAGLGRWRSLLFTFVLSSFAIIGGLALLIIPGIYIGVRLAFADYICVLEKRSAIDSIRQSWIESDDYFWLLFQGLILIYPAIRLLEWGVLEVLESADITSILIKLPAITAVDILSILITIYGFRIYCLARNNEAP